MIQSIEDLEIVYILTDSNPCLEVHRCQGEHCLLINSISPIDEFAEEKIQEVKKDIDTDFQTLYYENCPNYGLKVCMRIENYKIILSDDIEKHIQGGREE